MKEKAPPFENRMTGTQTVLGWIYLPVHVVLLPLLLGLYAAVSPDMTEMAVNQIYYGIGIVFVLCVYFRYLRDSFDTLLDNPLQCLIGLGVAFVVDYALSLAVSLVFLLLGDPGDTPNNTAIVDMATDNYGMVAAIAVFLAPIVEEVLFRGVVFGTLQPRSRIAAYACSALLFSIYHVWQFALAYADPAQLVYALRYVPVSLALAWCYERTGSIWTGILFHMGINALSMYVLNGA